MTEISRRSALKFASLAAVGAAVASPLPAYAATRTARSAKPAWPGHRPGKIHLGFSTQGTVDATIRRTGPVGLYRTYYSWTGGRGENRRILADYKAGRISWISFKPPSSAPGGWSAVASGRYDADVRKRARRYADLPGPIIVTFHHEPQNDRTGTGAQFAKAWCHIYDVMKDETGLKNVASVPVLGDWTFNPRNRRLDPADWVTGPMLDRCDFLGLDIYQNRSGAGFDERLGRILDWMAKRGHSEKMVGVAETGSTDEYHYDAPGEWWTRQWNWCARNTDKIGAVSYFNSLRHNNSGNNWLLWQSQAKLNAYKRSLKSSVSVGLR